MNTPKVHKALADMSRRDLDRFGKLYAERDQLVRTAAQSGVGVNEIARRTGLAKTTVLRILAPAHQLDDRGLIPTPPAEPADVLDGLTRAEVQDQLAETDSEDLTLHDPVDLRDVDPGQPRCQHGWLGHQIGGLGR